MVAAASWHSAARGVIIAGQIEGGWQTGMMITLAVGSAGVEGVKVLVRQLKPRPWVAVVVVGGLLFAWMLLPERARQAVRRGANAAFRVAQVAAEKAGASLEAHQRAMASVLTVDDPPWRRPTLVELCARHLAQTGAELTSAELRDHLRAALASPNFSSAAAIDRALDQHPAFVGRPRKTWRLGRGVQAA